jgi:hypothetical protein
MIRLLSFCRTKRERKKEKQKKKKKKGLWCMIQKDGLYSFAGSWEGGARRRIFTPF